MLRIMLYNSHIMIQKPKKLVVILYKKMVAAQNESHIFLVTVTKLNFPLPIFNNLNLTYKLKRMSKSETKTDYIRPTLITYRYTLANKQNHIHTYRL